MATVLTSEGNKGIVSKWIKQKGDKVKEGEGVVEFDTDKATFEFTAPATGTLLYIAVEEGETASGGSILAIIGEEGEDITEILSKIVPYEEENEKIQKQTFYSELPPPPRPLKERVKVEIKEGVYSGRRGYIDGYVIDKYYNEVTGKTHTWVDAIVIIGEKLKFIDIEDLRVINSESIF